MSIDYSLDRHNLRKIILDFPSQFRKGVEIGRASSLSNPLFPISNIIISGMGGSALPGDILNLFNKHLSLVGIPIYIHRNYGLPAEADKNSLVICISYSGNTEETVSTFKEARQQNLTLTCISSGGEIEKLSKEYQVPLARIEKDNIQPRYALGYQFGAVMGILYNCRLIKNEFLENLMNLESTIKPASLEEEGRGIAEKIQDKIPLIYASFQNLELARIIKIKFNENSKTPAFYNFFPELNHNEMVGFTNKADNFFALLIKDENDFSRNLKRIELTSKILRKYGSESEIVDMKGDNAIEKLLNTLLLGDWASYYLALLHNIDPTPVDMVEEFKKELK